MATEMMKQTARDVKSTKTEVRDISPSPSWRSMLVSVSCGHHLQDACKQHSPANEGDCGKEERLINLWQTTDTHKLARGKGESVQPETCHMNREGHQATTTLLLVRGCPPWHQRVRLQPYYAVSLGQEKSQRHIDRLHPQTY